MKTLFALKPTVKTTLTSLLNVALKLEKTTGRIENLEFKDGELHVSVNEQEIGNEIHVSESKGLIHTSSLLHANVIHAAKSIRKVMNLLFTQSLANNTIETFSINEKGIHIRTMIAVQSVIEPPTKAPQNKEEIILLIDGSNVLSRVFYATAMDMDNLMQAPDGRFTNAVTPFFRAIFRYMEQYKATHLAICFDEGKSFRHLMYPEYKAGRKETPAQLKEQFKTVIQMCQEVNLPLLKGNEVEADDYIASIAKLWCKHKKGKAYIVSNDKDLFQLIDHQVHQIVRKKKDDILYTVEQFQADFEGLNPKQIIDLKGISGDGSDNIKGIPGVGETGAFRLLKQYGSLEQVLKNAEHLPKEFSRYQKKIIAGKEEGIFSKKLATLKTDLEIKGVNFAYTLDKMAFIRWCNDLGIKKLKEEIEQQNVVLC